MRELLVLCEFENRWGRCRRGRRRRCRRRFRRKFRFMVRFMVRFLMARFQCRRRGNIWDQSRSWSWGRSWGWRLGLSGGGGGFVFGGFPGLRGGGWFGGIAFPLDYTLGLCGLLSPIGLGLLLRPSHRHFCGGFVCIFGCRDGRVRVKPRLLGGLLFKALELEPCGHGRAIGCDEPTTDMSGGTQLLGTFQLARGATSADTGAGRDETRLSNKGIATANAMRWMKDTEWIRGWARATATATGQAGTCVAPLLVLAGACWCWCWCFGWWPRTNCARVCLRSCMSCALSALSALR